MQGSILSHCLTWSLSSTGSSPFLLEILASLGFQKNHTLTDSPHLTIPALPVLLMDFSLSSLPVLLYLWDQSLGLFPRPVQPIPLSSRLIYSAVYLTSPLAYLIDSSNSTFPGQKSLPYSCPHQSALSSSIPRFFGLNNIMELHRKKITAFGVI